MIWKGEEPLFSSQQPRARARVLRENEARVVRNRSAVDSIRMTMTGAGMLMIRYQSRGNEKR